MYDSSSIQVPTVHVVDAQNTIIDSVEMKIFSSKLGRISKRDLATLSQLVKLAHWFMKVHSCPFATCLFL